jgi:release factor glutamine methyltransferase
VRDWEPKQALVPGPTGSEAYEALAPQALRALRPGGLVAVELGYRSDAAARGIFTAAGFEAIEVLPDLRGIPRVLVARRRR